MKYGFDVQRRFWNKTVVRDDLVFEGTPCILWTGAIKNKSKKATKHYGRFHARNLDGTVFWWLAHRFAYYLVHGDIPEGQEVDHLCRRTLCVNELHLEAVCGHENRRRAELHRVYTLTCPHGHLWAYENFSVRPNENYVCKVCVRNRTARWNRQREIDPMPKRTLADLTPECRNKHLRTKKNTRFTNAGVVICRECQTAASQRWQEKVKGR